MELHAAVHGGCLPRLSMPQPGQCSALNKLHWKPEREMSESTEPSGVGPLGREGVWCVLRLLVCPWVQTLGPVNSKDLTMGQHLFHQYLSEAWVGYGRKA